MASILKPLNSFGRIGSLTGPQWIELAINRAPQVIAGLAVIGIAWQAAQLTWLFISPTPPAATTNVAQNEPPSTTKAIDAQSIANAHLFGVANAPANADPNNLPQTQMSLVLAGTLALDDPEGGFAIVGENAATAKFYRAGSIINGGPRLHAVYADRVIIDRNGVLETLVLPRGAPSTAPAPVARNVVTTNPVVDNLRRIANNPTALGELLRAQPVFSNGVQKGYRVYPGRDRQQFVRLGLQPGDLVTAINGAALDDPARGTEILNTLTASTTAQVVVERNGTSQQLTLDMAQLSVPETATTDASSSSSSVSNGPPQGGISGFNGPAGNRGPRGTRNGNTPNGQPASASE